jgi:hypothetical protein
MTEEGRIANEIADRLAPPRPQTTINAQSALRLVLFLLTMWTLLSGLALTFFQGASAATIGGGLEGGQGEAAQRLLGVHLLVLAPVFGLIAWQPERYRLIAWVPYATQVGVVLVSLFDIVTGKRDIQGALLPLFVAATFLVLLVYVWREARSSETPEPKAPAIDALPSPATASPAPEAPPPEPKPEPPREDDISD